MHMSIDQLFEVVPSAPLPSKSKQVSGIIVYDSEREKFILHKQAELQHAEVNLLVSKLSDQFFTQL